jgi:hypothetical protein
VDDPPDERGAGAGARRIGGGMCVAGEGAGGDTSAYDEKDEPAAVLSGGRGVPTTAGGEPPGARTEPGSDGARLLPLPGRADHADVEIQLGSRPAWSTERPCPWPSLCACGRGDRLRREVVGRWRDFAFLRPQPASLLKSLYVPRMGCCLNQSGDGRTCCLEEELNKDFSRAAFGPV